MKDRNLNPLTLKGPAFKETWKPFPQLNPAVERGMQFLKLLGQTPEQRIASLMKDET